MPSETTTKDTKASAKRRALLVGINDYPGFNSDLPSCVDDVRAMTELLSRSYGFDCTVLVDQQATLSGVLDGIRALCADVTPDDRVVFYYSGHGASVPRADLIEESLVLADGSFLADDAFVAAFKDAPPGVSLVILDSCFSGGLAKFLGQPKALQVLADSAETAVRKSSRYKPFGGRPRPNFAGFTAVSKQPLVESDEATQESLNALLMSACLEGETALASTAQTNGLSAFTYAVLSVLSERANATTVADLLVAATEQLRRIGVPQTPQVKEPAAPLMLADAAFPTLTAIPKSSKSLDVSPARRKLTSMPNDAPTPIATNADAALATALWSLLSGVDWARLRSAGVTHI